MNEELPSTFWDGVAQFNQQAFYDCHDTLEALWLEAMDPERTFYQGILQIAVALYHLSHQNLRGATITLGEGLNRLRHYPADYGGIDLEQLRRQGLTLLAALQTTPDDQVLQLLGRLNLLQGEADRLQTQRLNPGDCDHESSNYTEPLQVPTIRLLTGISAG